MYLANPKIRIMIIKISYTQTNNRTTSPIFNSSRILAAALLDSEELLLFSSSVILFSFVRVFFVLFDLF